MIRPQRYKLIKTSPKKTNLKEKKNAYDVLQGLRVGQGSTSTTKGVAVRFGMHWTLK